MRGVGRARRGGQRAPHAGGLAHAAGGVGAGAAGLRLRRLRRAELRRQVSQQDQVCHVPGLRNYSEVTLLHSSPGRQRVGQQGATPTIGWHRCGSVELERFTSPSRRL